MYRVGIIGAGVSGMSAGKLLHEEFEVTILEKLSVHGGIARTSKVENVTFHRVGGHCFNSKYEEVLNFVFEKIMPENEWNKIERQAAIRFENTIIKYPIEYSVREIYSQNRSKAIAIVDDFLSANDSGVYANLEDWFIQKFGRTLAESYFIPYNTKIWGRSPKEMSPDWVQDKLPIPDRESFIDSLMAMNANGDKMPHRVFYYPKSNDQLSFIDKLANNLNIRYDYHVSSIERSVDGSSWIVNESLEFDILISTMPLNLIPQVLDECPDEVVLAASKLKYNRVTTMLWESKETDNTWTYLPSDSSLFHRYIHIGNFFRPRQNYTIVEAVGERTEKEMIDNGMLDPFLLRPIEFNVSDHAYVLYDMNYKESKRILLEYLSDIGLHTLGRFGEWDYYNMDVCIKKAIDLSALLKDESN